jgi:hypothetical protein
LDEVSIYSLIGSRLGPIASEFTDKQVASLKVEVPKALTGGVESSSQVVRKSMIQTTFKDLYESEEKSLVIHPPDETTNLPEVGSFDDLLEKWESLTDQGWIVDPNNLERGRLFEIEVELESVDIFNVSTVSSALSSMVEEDSGMFERDVVAQLGQVKSIGRILEKLLVGLVPVRGRAVDYEIVTLSGRPLIIHRKLLIKLSSREAYPRYQLCVVGVAERGLFWKDVRRILFSNARFRVLCRLAQPGLQETWTPVKLAHALESVLPGFGKKIEALGTDLRTAITNSSTSKQSNDRTHRQVTQVLVNYAKLLASKYGHNLDAGEIADVELISQAHNSSLGNIEERRKAFDAIAEFVLTHFDIERNHEIVAELRSTALFEAGLDLQGQPLALPIPAAVEPIDRVSTDRFLDSEFVAIYW